MEEKKTPIYKDKDFIKQYNKKYYEDNKEKICDLVNQKVICEVCGKTMAKSNIYNHMKRNVCIKKRRLQVHEQKIYELEQKIKELEDKYVTKISGAL